MERIEKKELSVAELEEQRLELLPDRIEMNRFRNKARSGARFGDNLDASDDDVTIIVISA